MPRLAKSYLVLLQSCLRRNAGLRLSKEIAVSSRKPVGGREVAFRCVHLAFASRVANLGLPWEMGCSYLATLSRGVRRDGWASQAICTKHVWSHAGQCCQLGYQ